MQYSSSPSLSLSRMNISTGTSPLSIYLSTSPNRYGKHTRIIQVLRRREQRESGLLCNRNIARVIHLSVHLDQHAIISITRLALLECVFNLQPFILLRISNCARRQWSPIRFGSLSIIGCLLPRQRRHTLRLTTTTAASSSSLSHAYDHHDSIDAQMSSSLSNVSIVDIVAALDSRPEQALVFLVCSSTVFRPVVSESSTATGAHRLRLSLWLSLLDASRCLRRPLRIERSAFVEEGRRGCGDSDLERSSMLEGPSRTSVWRWRAARARSCETTVWRATELWFVINKLYCAFF